MFSSIDDYRTKFEKELKMAIEKMGDPSRLRDACSYALLNGGKRLRPTLVYLVAEALGQNRDVTALALSVEYFHTASLIADDLPCMDDDDMRRNQPSLHKAFDESTALLATYTLVAAGYGAIYDANQSHKNQFPQEVAQIDAVTILCLETVSRSAGLRGATHGQFIDLFPPDKTYETIRTIILQKTATLFEICFVLGWLFGGGSDKSLEEVKQCARHLGVAFQIADDCQDFKQDDHQASEINIAHVLGHEKALELFDEELQGFSQMLQTLGLWTRPFQRLCKELRRSTSRPAVSGPA
ncbi:MAG: ispA [Parachlamydiales bacterium]|nr:ispA [Parachlamydiales bacterium]